MDMPPQDLTLHAALRAQPGSWADEDPRFVALCRDIREQGLLCPLLVTGAKEIVDGRHRWRAAKRLGLPVVPCQLVDGLRAAEIILGSLLARRHYTPGQRAYLVADLIHDAWQAAKAREQANRRTNFGRMLQSANCVRAVENQPLTQISGAEPGAYNAPDALPAAPAPDGLVVAYNAPAEAPPTVETYARGLGVTVRLLQQARQIWQHYRAHTEPFEWSDEVLAATGRPPGTRLTLRDYFEPLILDDETPMGLGRALEGMGQKITQREREEKYGRPHQGRAAALASAERQLELFSEAWRTVALRAREYWPKLPPAAQAEAYHALEAELASAPDDFVGGLRAVINKEWKRRQAHE